jgi:hypothetical protein
MNNKLFIRLALLQYARLISGREIKLGCFRDFLCARYGQSFREVLDEELVAPIRWFGKRSYLELKKFENSWCNLACPRRI